MYFLFTRNIGNSAHCILDHLNEAVGGGGGGVRGSLWMVRCLFLMRSPFCIPRKDWLGTE